MRYLIALIFLTFHFTASAQGDIKDYIFPDGLISSRYHFYDSVGVRDSNSIMKIEYTVEKNKALITTTQWQSGNYLSGKIQNFRITDSAIYLINSKENLNGNNFIYFDDSNCFLKLPPENTVSWEYKESKTTGYKCTSSYVTLTFPHGEYVALEVIKTPIENGKLLSKYQSMLYYVLEKGLISETVISTGKKLYSMSSSDWRKD